MCLKKKRFSISAEKLTWTILLLNHVTSVLSVAKVFDYGTQTTNHMQCRDQKFSKEGLFVAQSSAMAWVWHLAGFLLNEKFGLNQWLKNKNV